MREFPAMLCKLDRAPGYANIFLYFFFFSFFLFVPWIISCNRDKYSIRFMIPVVIILAFFSSKFLAFQKE